MSLTYLARPIDQAGRGSYGSIMETIRQALALADVPIYDPGAAFKLYPGSSPQALLAIDSINRSALDRCGSLVAALPAGVPTLGTPVEVERAISAGKPVIIVTNNGLEGRSVQMSGWAASGATICTVDTMPSGLDLREALAARTFAEQPQPDVLPVVLEHDEARLPSRAYPDDAGLDLASTENVVVMPNGRAMVKTDVRVALPPGTWGLITGRSSTWHKRGLLVIQSVIDVGWRGPLCVSVHNPYPDPVSVQAGERLGQLVILPAWQGKVEQAIDLVPHQRGTNGYGSSGL